VLALLDGQIAAADLTSSPLIATHVGGSPGGPSYLAMSLHGMVGDTTSRDVLLMDLFTAFGQHLAGQPIVLQPTTTPWLEWSQRCATLATHSGVLGSREYWLHTVAAPTLHIADVALAERPGANDLVRLPSALTTSETAEIDDARRRVRLPIDEILLAALGRTIAGTVGDGVLAVDLGGPGRSVLKPDVDLGRTVGSFTTLYPLALHCSVGKDTSARQRFDEVHDAVAAVPHYGIGYGLLRHLYGPTARHLESAPRAEILFSYAGAIPELPGLIPDDAAVQFDPDTALPVREALPGLGHAIELRAYRSAGVPAPGLVVRRAPHRVGVRRIAGAGTHLGAAGPGARRGRRGTKMESANEELALVDLSSSDLGLGDANARH
jgi:phthiocerol/phenolphthiocerol synthesis type-I polyketide synthase E